MFLENFCCEVCPYLVSDGEDPWNVQLLLRITELVPRQSLFATASKPEIHLNNSLFGNTISTSQRTNKMAAKRIWGSQTDDCEEDCLPGCDTVQFVRSSAAFLSNVHELLQDYTASHLIRKWCSYCISATKTNLLFQFREMSLFIVRNTGSMYVHSVGTMQSFWLLNQAYIQLPVL
jgi:hypothetical protein